MAVEMEPGGHCDCCGGCGEKRGESSSRLPLLWHLARGASSSERVARGRSPSVSRPEPERNITVRPGAFDAFPTVAVPAADTERGVPGEGATGYGFRSGFVRHTHT